MATQFILESVLKLRDDLSGPVTNIFQRVENLGDRAARRVGKALREKLSDADTYKRAGHVIKRGVQGVAAATTAAAFGLDHALERMARTARMGEELGIGPGFLAGLETAAAEKGIENVDDVSRSLEEFGLRLSELRAKKPSGELFSKLGDIGASAFIKQLREAETGTDALILALSALASETDPANRTSLADALFGGSDAALDLRRLASSREELGRVIDAARASAKTTDAQFHAARRYSEAKARLLGRVRDVAFALSSRLAPAFKAAADRASAWIDANRALIDQRLGEFADWAAERIGALIALDWAGWLEAAREPAGDLIDVLAGLGKIALKVAKFAIALAKQLSSWARRLGIDANALATAGKLLVIAWAATKLLGIASALRTLATRAVELIGGLRAVPGAARRAKLAMAAMFTGGIGLALSLAGAIAEIVGGMRDVRAESERAEVGFDVAGLEAPVVDALNREREKLDSMRDELAAMKRADRTGFKRGHLAPQISALEERIDAAEQRARSLANRKLTLEFIGEVLSGDIKTEKDARLRQGAEMFVRGQTDDRDAKALMREAKRRGLDVEVLADALGGERKKRERVEQNEAALARVDATRTARRDAADAFGGDSAGPLGSAIGQALRRDIEPAAQRLERAGSAIEEMARTMQLMLSEQRTRANLGVR